MPVGGAPDAVHDAVVSIATAADAAAPELCTGVVVAPRVVLTAGHCTLGRAPGDLVLGVGPSASAPTRTLPVLSVHTYPRFSGTDDDVAQGRDLGALVLAQDAGVTPIAMVTSGEGSLVGAVTTLVGFGQTVATDPGSSGRRASVSVRIESACDRLLALGDGAHEACNGDSGAPLLVTSGGVELVAAVVSYGADADVPCSPPAYAVRTDAYAAWIQSVTAGTPDDACARTCPPMTADCAVDAGMAAGGDAAAADAAEDAASFPRGLSAGGGCESCPGGDRSSRFTAALLLASVVFLNIRRSETKRKFRR